MMTVQSVTNEEQFIGTINVTSKFSATDFQRHYFIFYVVSQNILAVKCKHFPFNMLPF